MIGKFDILATMDYAKQRLAGMPDDEAKAHGFAIAVIGAQGKGFGRKTSTAVLAQSAAKRKKDNSITAESFNKVIRKIGYSFFHGTFYPFIEHLVQLGYSYERIKSIIGIVPTRGAKMTDEQFTEVVNKFLAAK